MNQHRYNLLPAAIRKDVDRKIDRVLTALEYSLEHGEFDLVRCPVGTAYIIILMGLGIYTKVYRATRKDYNRYVLHAAPEAAICVVDEYIDHMIEKELEFYHNFLQSNRGEPVVERVAKPVEDEITPTGRIVRLFDRQHWRSAGRGLIFGASSLGGNSFAI